MLVLGGGRFLMSEVSLYTYQPSPFPGGNCAWLSHRPVQILHGFGNRGTGTLEHEHASVNNIPYRVTSLIRNRHPP